MAETQVKRNPSKETGDSSTKKQKIIPSHEKIHLMEKTIQFDIGNRGIGDFVLPSGELLRGAQSLFRLKGTSNSAAIITGFPCVLESDPPTETDGPLGAVAIARAFLATTEPEDSKDACRGPSLYMLTDECNEAVLRATLESAGIMNDRRLIFECFPPKPKWTDENTKRLNELSAQLTTSVAIERTGPGQDGGYYTMRANDMTDILAPLHQIMEPRDTVIGGLAFESVAIGDGGNEVGMGKVRAKILESTVPFAEKVACVVAADHLIVCGVSNWGGNALGAAMTLLNIDTGMKDATACWEKAMPTEAEDRVILDAMVGAGARDGCSRLLEATVDGYPFEDSLKITNKIAEICLDITK